MREANILEEKKAIRAAVITVSDTREEDDDASGNALSGSLLEFGAEVIGKTIVPDDHEQIANLMRKLADAGELDLIITTGGTGLSPRDVTPEATLAVIDRQAPGITDALRRETAAATPTAMLSRGICGIRGRTLIVNFPGSPKAVVECFEVLRRVLKHAVDQLRGAGKH